MTLPSLPASLDGVRYHGDTILASRHHWDLDRDPIVGEEVNVSNGHRDERAVFVETSEWGQLVLHAKVSQFGSIITREAEAEMRRTRPAMFERPADSVIADEVIVQVWVRRNTDPDKVAERTQLVRERLAGWLSSGAVPGIDIEVS